MVIHLLKKIKLVTNTYNTIFLAFGEDYPLQEGKKNYLKIITIYYRYVALSKVIELIKLEGGSYIIGLHVNINRLQNQRVNYFTNSGRNT